MKKEIDTYRLMHLFDALKKAMLWGWYLSAVVIGATLWFFPLPGTRIQTFGFVAAFVWYSVLSVLIAKVDRIRGEIE